MTFTPPLSNAPATSGPVLQLLASGLQLWLRQHCQVEGQLNLQLHGSALNLLRGRLEGVSLQAHRVTYQDLRIERVDLRSGAIRVQMGKLLKGESLQLDQAFVIQGLVGFCPLQLTRSFSTARWRGLADWLAEQLLGQPPLLELRISGHRLVLIGQGSAPHQRVELETCLAAAPGGLAIRSGDNQSQLLHLPMDGAIGLEAARIDDDLVVLEGTAQVTP